VRNATVSKKGGIYMPGRKTRVNAVTNEEIIAALLQSPTVKEAAKSCGMDYTVIYDRLKEPAFKEQYQAARQEVIQQAITYVQSVTAAAIKRLHDIMNDPEVAPQIQVNAAESILRNSLKLTEQGEIMQQLAEIKAALNYD
jgi:hypothetical protein